VKVQPALKSIAELGMVLCVHGEVTDPNIDIFDREKEFIRQRLVLLLEQIASLRVVMEHITTKDAVQFVQSAGERVAATITPQHILHNRNALFSQGLRPHFWCLPVLKREEHRAAVLEAAVSGNSCFFLGTDSAPHPREAKESVCGCAGIFSAPVAMPLYAHAFEQAGKLGNLEAFASINGPVFYGLPRNTHTMTLVKEPWTIPESFTFGASVVVPMWAGQTIDWKVVD
jgi:dihydroorotase